MPWTDVSLAPSAWMRTNRSAPAVVGHLRPLDVGDVDVLGGAGHDHLDAVGLQGVAELEADGEHQLALGRAGVDAAGAAADLGLRLARARSDRLLLVVGLGLMPGVDDHHVAAVTAAAAVVGEKRWSWLGRCSKQSARMVDGRRGRGGCGASTVVVASTAVVEGSTATVAGDGRRPSRLACRTGEGQRQGRPPTDRRITTATTQAHGSMRIFRRRARCGLEAP